MHAYEDDNPLSNDGTAQVQHAYVVMVHGDLGAVDCEFLYSELNEVCAVD